MSNFARAPEHHSRHNRKYWDHTPYLGVGPSAHSLRAGRRWWNHRGAGAWEAAIGEGRRPIEAREELTTVDRARERVLLAMRTTEGLGLEELERYGAEGAVDLGAVDRLVERGLVETSGSRLRPTLAGLAVADSLALELTR